MKPFKIYPIMIIALLAFGTSSNADKTPPQFRNKQIPQVPCGLRQLPDILVSSFTVKLDSTDVGTDRDFPHDRVSLHLELSNGGNLAVPPGTVLHVVFKRNAEEIKAMDLPNGLGDKGSRVAMGASDSFPHGQPTTYFVEVTAPIQECSTSNNRASLAIDESKLHPGRAPDFTCSMFTAEKRWTHVGDEMKGSFYFAADVENLGQGYCQDDGKPVDLQFYLTTNKSWPRAYVRIPKRDLPGPKARKRFSVEVPEAKLGLPPGKLSICAFLPSTPDEANKQNGWSTNTAAFVNSGVPLNGSMARVKFPPWGMIGRVLTIRIDVQNMQYQAIPDLRLILLKNGAILKEWKSVELSPAATLRKSTTDDRPIVEGPDEDEYRVILTTNQSGANPPADQVLDSQPRMFRHVEVPAGVLQALLTVPETGLGKPVKQMNGRINVFDDKTKVAISPQSFKLQVEGNYRLDGGAHVGFKARFGLTLHARNGSLISEVVDKDIKIGSKLSEAFLDILTVGLYEAIKYGIEKGLENGLKGTLNLGNVIGGYSPCGIVLCDGYLYLYHPYST